MRIGLRSWVGVFALGLGAAGFVHAGGHDHHAAPVVSKSAGSDALKALMAGNARFMAGTVTAERRDPGRRAALAKGQNPIAIVLSCSDSRVPPEIVFDQGLGDLFVVRVAGNVADEVALGSIEYAAEHLGTPLLLVLGHEACGAVKAALGAKGEPEGNIGALLRLVLPAVRQSRDTSQTRPGVDLTDLTVRTNASMSLAAVLKRSDALFRLVNAGRLTTAKGVYHLASGRVELLK